MTPNPSVNGYIRKNQKWQPELEKLRSIALSSELTEEMKWKVPVYISEGHNILAISALKDYAALSFFKGTLLKDPDGLLIQPGQNTQSARLIKFTSLQEIADLESTLKTYIQEAIEAEKAGLKVDFKKTEEFPVPTELQNKFDESPALKAAFEALTPGRQRAYLLHFSAPKQPKTRESRIEKSIPQILEGKGLNEPKKQNNAGS